MRFRFDEHELSLLRGAERVWGAHLAHLSRTDALRQAMNLARLGRKLASLQPGEPVSLAESDLALLLESLRITAFEVRWLGEHSHPATEQTARRRSALEDGFPGLTGRDQWRSFGLARDIDAFAARLQQAAASH